MTNEKKSYAKKIMTANKDLVSKTFNKTHEVAEKTVDYNRDIWLAGLGVFAEARTEGKQAFDKMVTRGEEFETKTRQKLEEQTASVKEKITEAFDKVSETVANVSESAANISKPSASLEDIFDTRVARAIKRLGTPTASALNTIIEQLADISAKLKEIGENNQEKAEVNIAATNKPATKKADETA